MKWQDPHKQCNGTTLCSSSEMSSVLLEDATCIKCCLTWCRLCRRLVDPIFEQNLGRWCADWPSTLLQVGWAAIQSRLVLCVQCWLKCVASQCCTLELWRLCLFQGKKNNKQLRSLVSICVTHKPCHSFWEAQRWKHTCYIWEHGLGEPLWQFMHICTGGILQLETEAGKQVEGVTVEHSIACPDKPLSPAFRQQDRLLQICHLSASFPCYSPAGVRGCVVVTDLPRTIK